MDATDATSSVIGGAAGIVLTLFVVGLICAALVAAGKRTLGPVGALIGAVFGGVILTATVAALVS